MALEIAKAYVQIVPTTKGIKNSIQSALGNGTEVGGSYGKKIGSGITDGLKKTASAIGKAAVGLLAGATTAIVALGKKSVQSYAEYEQLWGGAEKIFSGMDTSKILNDAQKAYKNLGMSTDEYLSKINDVGASFKATMGDEKGYNTAKVGLKAISDYATGTGKDIGVLSEKFTMITRATSSYQTIADQFSGMLPATSKDFLEQAKSAGFLKDEYTKLTEVPIDEYQQAVTLMLEKGVTALGLAGNTAQEASDTLSGSFGMMSASWQNLVIGFSNPDADLGKLISEMVGSVISVGKNLIPVIVDMLPKVVSGIGELIKRLAPEIPKVLKKLLPVIISSITLLISIFSSQLPSLITIIVPPLISGVIQAIKALVGGLPEIVSAITSILPTLINSVFNELIPCILEVLPTLITTLVNGLVDLLPQLLNGLVMLIDTLASNIGSIIDAVIITIPIITDAVCDALITYLPILLQGIIKLVLAIVDKLPDLIQSLVDQIPKIISTIVVLIVDNLPVIIKGIAQIIIGIVSALPGLLKTIWDSLTNWIDGLADGIAKLWVKFKNSAKTWISKMLEGIKGEWASVKSWASNIWTSVSQWFSSLWSKLVSIGENIVNGIWQGIKNIWNNLKTWFANAWNNLVGGVKDFLGIHSPSRLFADIGKNVALGFGLGFENAFDSVRNDMMSDFDALTVGANFTTRFELPNKQDSSTGYNVVQNIYAQKMSPAQLLRETQIMQERAVFIGA